MTTSLSTMARLAVDPDRLGAHLRDKSDNTTGSASDDEPDDAPGVREPDEPEEPPGVREPDDPSGVGEPDDAD